MCDEAILENAGTLKFVHSIADQCKTQEMCDTVVPEDSSRIVYCPDSRNV